MFLQNYGINYVRVWNNLISIRPHLSCYVQIVKRVTHSDGCDQAQSSNYSELPSPERSVEANESIISLLLKLHSHLSGNPDSFNPEEPETERDSRIGDGPFFVGKVLYRIVELDSFCRCVCSCIFLLVFWKAQEAF